MAPAEDPRTPEGMEGDGQSSPGPSALHGPQPSCLSSQGTQGLQRTPRMGCPAPPRASVSPSLALSLSDPAGICPQGLTMCPWSWRYWVLRTAGRDCQTPEEAPGLGCGPPTGRADPGTRELLCGRSRPFWYINYPFTACHLFIFCHVPANKGRRQLVTKRLWLPHAAARTGDRDARAEADGHRQGRGPARGRRRQAPAALQAGGPLCPGNRAPEGRGGWGLEPLPHWRPHPAPWL